MQRRDFMRGSAACAAGAALAAVPEKLLATEAPTVNTASLAATLVDGKLEPVVPPAPVVDTGDCDLLISVDGHQVNEMLKSIRGSINQIAKALGVELPAETRAILGGELVRTSHELKAVTGFVPPEKPTNDVFTRESSLQEEIAWSPQDELAWREKNPGPCASTGPQGATGVFTSVPSNNQLMRFRQMLEIHGYGHMPCNVVHRPGQPFAFSMRFNTLREMQLAAAKMPSEVAGVPIVFSQLEQYRTRSEALGVPTAFALAHLLNAAYAKDDETIKRLFEGGDFDTDIANGRIAIRTGYKGELITAWGEGPFTSVDRELNPEWFEAEKQRSASLDKIAYAIAKKLQTMNVPPTATRVNITIDVPVSLEKAEVHLVI